MAKKVINRLADDDRFKCVGILKKIHDGATCYDSHAQLAARLEKDIGRKVTEANARSLIDNAEIAFEAFNPARVVRNAPITKPADARIAELERVAADLSERVAKLEFFNSEKVSKVAAERNGAGYENANRNY